MSKIDLTGKKIGRLTVIQKLDRNGNRDNYWLCQCECGSSTAVTSNGLTSGRTKSCGCLKRDTIAALNFDDITGKKFGRWTVLRKAKDKTKSKRNRWECICECGTIRNVDGTSMKKGISKSCGCYKEEVSGKQRLKDLAGMKFGRLTVLEIAPSGRRGGVYWKCICECGTIKNVLSSNLLQGKIQSCGCYGQERRRLEPGEAAFKKVLRNYTGNAQRRGITFNLSEDDFREIITKPCHYCGDADSCLSVASNGNYVYNGIDRIDNNKGYMLGNVVACCRRCNRSKDVYSQEEFLSWIKRIASHHKEA